MILLPKENRVLGETVSQKILHDSEEKVEPIDVRLFDFDDVSYRVLIEEKTKNILQVAMNLPFWNTIEKFGAKAAFDAAFGNYVCEPLQSFDVTVKINLDDLKDQKQKEELVQKLACMKATVIGGVFEHFFDSMMAGKTLEPFQFDLRSDTTVYLFPKGDRVIVIFGIDFKEKMDRAIAKVFMHEFLEARRQVQGLGSAPPVQWGSAPPMELAHFNITEPQKDKIGYISFAVLKSHLDSALKKSKITPVLVSFRTYVQYHIKCSKSYFHQCMRARVISLLQVLNRAKFEVPVADAKKTTITGKTFQRK